MPGVFRLAGGELTLPTGVIVDADVNSAAAISVDKVKHQYQRHTTFNLNSDDTPVTKEEVVFVAGASGTIRGFHCLLVDTGTSTDVDFDLKVNGSSVLSSTVQITHSNGDLAVVDGTISSASLTVDDVVSISITVTSSTGALGPYAWVNIAEDSAPS